MFPDTLKCQKPLDAIASLQAKFKVCMYNLIECPRIASLSNCCQFIVMHNDTFPSLRLNGLILCVTEGYFKDSHWHRGLDKNKNKIRTFLLHKFYLMHMYICKCKFEHANV